MNNGNTKTDLVRLDAMKDADIVYDEDTGAPFTDAELDQAVKDGFTANGMEDLRSKMKDKMKELAARR